MCKEIYVKEMPKDCWDCPCQDKENGLCKILNRYVDYIPKDCPLHSLKAHDRELVKEVCEKIRDNIEARNAYELDIINRLAILLDKIEKEYENEKFN